MLAGRGGVLLKVIVAAGKLSVEIVKVSATPVMKVVEVLLVKTGAKFIFNVKD